MWFHLGSGLLVGSTLLVMVAGDCNTFTFHANDVYDAPGYLTNPYVQYATPFHQVSPAINCTSALAKKAGNDTTCEFHRYAMGLRAQPEIANETFTPGNHRLELLKADEATRENIFSLVQAANPPNITRVNFNATVVINYTANAIDAPDFAVGQAGAHYFAHEIACCNGTVSECESGSRFEGQRLLVCGIRWLDDEQYLLPPGQQQYSGTHQLIPMPTNTSDAGKDPQPTYDEEAGNATAVQNMNSTGGSGTDDNDESGAWAMHVNLLVLMTFVGCTVMSVSGL
ncbi:hypothetical protein F4808DRAFT_269618 [Astrocystis sublimbata]|nr:hypothetical protein F4808DRAFT_269618 [Astrocystis sublimbata]